MLRGRNGRGIGFGLLVAVTALGVTASVLAAGLSRNVPVTGPEPASYGTPWIAADPARASHLAIGYSDSSNFSACYLALSSNGGRSWHNRRVVGQGTRYPLASGLDACEYPTVAYGPANTLYYAYVALKTGSWPPPAFMYVITSHNGGRAFGRPVRVEREGSSSDILPKMAVDRASGRLYIAFQRNTRQAAESTGFLAMLVSSGDHGRSFSRASFVTRRNAYMPDVTVGGDGRVYVAYNDDNRFNASQGRRPMEMMVASSRNHGRSFGHPRMALPMASCFSATFTCQQDPQGTYVYNPGFEIAAGASPNQVFVVGDSLAGSATGTPIFRTEFAASLDGGRHWARHIPLRIPIGEQAASQLGNPTIGVAPNGRIDVAYYNLEEPAGLESTFLASSCDGGKRFTKPSAVSSRSSNVAVQSSFGFPDEPYSVGHLNAATDTASLVAWSDTRRGNRTNAKNDVYFARVSPLCHA